MLLGLGLGGHPLWTKWGSRRRRGRLGESPELAVHLPTCGTADEQEGHARDDDEDRPITAEQDEAQGRDEPDVGRLGRPPEGDLGDGPRLEARQLTGL